MRTFTLSMALLAPIAWAGGSIARGDIGNTLGAVLLGALILGLYHVTGTPRRARQQP